MFRGPSSNKPVTGTFPFNLLAFYIGLILGVTGVRPVDVAVLLLHWYDHLLLTRVLDRFLGDSLEFGPLGLRQLLQTAALFSNSLGSCYQVRILITVDGLLPAVGRVAVIEKSWDCVVLTPSPRFVLLVYVG